MRLKTFGALKKSTVTAVTVACAGLAGCSASGSAASQSHAVASAQYGPVPVTGRAAKPTDVNAGGIVVGAKTLEFSVGSANIVISYNDWNTITAASDVPVDVGLMLDPGYNANDVVQNRFQYLADRIALLKFSKFGVFGINSSLAYGKYGSTVAIYNPTDEVMQISSLGIKILSVPSNVTIADHLFYSAAHEECIVPAHTIYFAFLEFSRFSHLPQNGASISNNYSYNLISCPGQVCSNGTPISLCKE